MLEWVDGHPPTPGDLASNSVDCSQALGKMEDVPIFIPREILLVGWKELGLGGKSVGGLCICLPLPLLSKTGSDVAQVSFKLSMW